MLMFVRAARQQNKAIVQALNRTIAVPDSTSMQVKTLQPAPVPHVRAKLLPFAGVLTDVPVLLPAVVCLCLLALLAALALRLLLLRITRFDPRS
jgi:hypothetical protein